MRRERKKKDVVPTFNHQEIIAVIAVCDEYFFSDFFSAFLAKGSHLFQNLWSKMASYIPYTRSLTTLYPQPDLSNPTAH